MATLVNKKFFTGSSVYPNAVSQSSCNQIRERIYKPNNDSTSNRRLCPFSQEEMFEHAQNLPLDITGHCQARSGFTG